MKCPFVLRFKFLLKRCEIFSFEERKISFSYFKFSCYYRSEMSLKENTRNSIQNGEYPILEKPKSTATR